MDHSLLRSWLGLPSGPWPPDHYALIGIAPAPFDPEAVERIVLDRMARLRSHQLLHPELVTEGMNRLAQALVCLTDPVARAAYDAELGIPPPVQPPPSVMTRPRSAPPPVPIAVEESIPGFPIPVDEDPSPPDATQVIEVRFTPGLAPPEAGSPGYEIVEEEPFEIPAFEVVPEAEIEPPLMASPRPQWQPASRRELYARLAALRRTRSAWVKLKPHLADPRERLDRPISVLLYLEAVLELRSALNHTPDLIGDPWRAGGLVAALIRQPLCLDAFRVLLPDQRRAIAQDWRNGDAELEREYNRLRELSRSGRKRRRPFRRRSRLMKAMRWTLRNPESILIGLGIAVLVVAFVRASVGR